MLHLNKPTVEFYLAHFMFLFNVTIVFEYTRPVRFRFFKEFLLHPSSRAKATLERFEKCITDTKSTPGGTQSTSTAVTETEH